MSISCIRAFSIVCFLFSFLGYAQDTDGFWEPAFALNHKINDSYKVNFGVKSRSHIYKDNTLQHETRQLEFIHFSTWSLNSNHSLSGGIMYRFRDLFNKGHDELRLTQQYNYAVRPTSVRFGHRFRTEQRIRDITIHRFRYRFAIDFPLEGEKLDVKELYLVNALEWLCSVNKESKPQFDQRITTQLGWLVHKNLKLQTGFEYRFENFNNDTAHLFLVLTSAILKL